MDSDVVDAPTGVVLLPRFGRFLGHLTWRAQARAGDALDEGLPAGVDIHAHATLLALAGGAARSQQEIADAISVSRTTLGRVAADLTAAGLVTRVRNPADRRSYLLTRTPEGAAASRRWRRHAEDIEDRLTAGFSAAEREELRTLLLALVDDELSPYAPSDLRDSLGFLVNRVHQRMHRHFAAGLADIPLEPWQFGTLSALTELGPVPQAELARSLGCSSASVVQFVDTLEHLDLVERRRSEADRRTQILHLRPAAAGVLARARTASEATLAERLAPLDDHQRERLTELLQRFVLAP